MADELDSSVDVASHETQRQLALGHLAQASWHLQHALAYCPPSSSKLSAITSAADTFSKMVEPIGRLFWYVRAYKPDESSVRYFGDELSLAMIHLQTCRAVNNRLPRWFAIVKPAEIDGLIASLLRLMSGIKSPVDQSAKEFNRRVKARTEIAQAPLVLKAVRRAEKRFDKIDKAKRKQRPEAENVEDDVDVR